MLLYYYTVFVPFRCYFFPKIYSVSPFISQILRAAPSPSTWLPCLPVHPLIQHYKITDFMSLCLPLWTTQHIVVLHIICLLGHNNIYWELERRIICYLYIIYRRIYHCFPYSLIIEEQLIVPYSTVRSRPNSYSVSFFFQRCRNFSAAHQKSIFKVTIDFIILSLYVKFTFPYYWKLKKRKKGARFWHFLTMNLSSSTPLQI